jgi:hypothetical protein
MDEITPRASPVGDTLTNPFPSRPPHLATQDSSRLLCKLRKFPPLCTIRTLAYSMVTWLVRHACDGRLCSSGLWPGHHYLFHLYDAALIFNETERNDVAGWSIKRRDIFCLEVLKLLSSLFIVCFVIRACFSYDGSVGFFVRLHFTFFFRI